MKEYAFQILMEFVKKFPDSTDGPGHILFEDGNSSDGHINWIIGLTEAAIDKLNKTISEEYLQVLEARNWFNEHTVEELQSTVIFLKSFIEIPEQHRVCTN